MTLIEYLIPVTLSLMAIFSTGLTAAVPAVEVTSAPRDVAPPITAYRYINITDLSDISLDSRDILAGNVKADFYLTTDCTGAHATISGFGCSSDCWSFNVDIRSVDLTQSIDRQPKPTSDLFASSDCSGSRLTHAGIVNNALHSCTTTTNNARSAHVYYDC